MTTIVTRTTVGSNTGKGSPLTHTEVDTNFVNLNTAKLETAAIPLGTLQAPSVSFLNDSDTGIFCPQGGNSLAVATGGQYAITCTSTQAVGIKTANPQKALHVAGPTRVGADDATDAFLEIGEGATGNRNSYIDIVADTTYTDYGLRIIRNNTGANATSELKHRGTGALNFTTQDAAPIVFNTTNSPRLTILAGGNVGIGTSSPGDKLDVYAGSLSVGSHYVATVNTDYKMRLRSVGAATNNNYLVEIGATGSGPQPADSDMTFATQTWNGSAYVTTEKARLTATGRLGIGTTTVDELLHLKGASTTNTTLKIESSSTASERSSVNFFNGAVSRGRIGGSNDFDGLTLDSSTTEAAASIRFRTGGTSLSPKMTLDSSGRLLVGTVTQVGNVNGGILQLGSGITFPANPVAASDPNTLDDYEEGTFLPTVNGSTTAGTGTYTSRSGKYTKIGNVVTFCLDFILSAHTGTGDMLVAGLPFPSDAINYQANIVARQNLSLTASHYFGGSFISPSTSFVELSQMPVGGGTPAAIPMDSVCDVRLQGFYYV